MVLGMYFSCNLLLDSCIEEEMTGALYTFLKKRKNLAYNDFMCSSDVCIFKEQKEKGRVLRKIDT